MVREFIEFKDWMTRLFIIFVMDAYGAGFCQWLLGLACGMVLSSCDKKMRDCQSILLLGDAGYGVFGYEVSFCGSVFDGEFVEGVGEG